MALYTIICSVLLLNIARSSLSLPASRQPSVKGSAFDNGDASPLFPLLGDSRKYLLRVDVRDVPSCSERTLFDRLLRRCNIVTDPGFAPGYRTVPEILKDDAAPQCSPKNKGFIEFLPHPVDCAMFYMCSHGRPVLKRCSENLHFNLELMVCDHPHQAGCNSKRFVLKKLLSKL